MGFGQSLVGTATVQLNEFMALDNSGGWIPKLLGHEIIDEKNLADEIDEEQIAEESTVKSVMYLAEYMAATKSEKWAEAWVRNNKDEDDNPIWNNKDVWVEECVEKGRKSIKSHWNVYKEHERLINNGTYEDEKIFPVYDRSSSKKIWRLGYSDPSQVREIKNLFLMS